MAFDWRDEFDSGFCEEIIYINGSSLIYKSLTS